MCIVKSCRFFPVFFRLPHKAASRNQDKTPLHAGERRAFRVFLSLVVCFVCGRGNSKQTRQWRTSQKLPLLVCLLNDVTEKKKKEKKKPSGCKYPTLHTLQSPLGQMCQAHVGGRTEQHISYGPKTWSTNIFYIIIIQNEWKFLPPSSSPKNIAHYEHRAMLPTLQEHKYHLSLFVLCSSWKVEKWLRDKWFLKSPQGL